MDCRRRPRACSSSSSSLLLPLLLLPLPLSPLLSPAATAAALIAAETCYIEWVCIINRTPLLGSNRMLAGILASQLTFFFR